MTECQAMDYRRLINVQIRRVSYLHVISPEVIILRLDKNVLYERNPYTYAMPYLLRSFTCAL